MARKSPCALSLIHILRKIVRKVMKEHKRIIFNGDGYSEAWTEEAKRRGLLNLPTTVDALPRLSLIHIW